MRMAMTSEIIAPPAHPESGAAAAPDRARVIGGMPGPGRLRPARPPSQPGDPPTPAPPPVLVRHTWARPLCQPSGILLGAGREPYETASAALETGDLLLFYSDGLIERRDRPLEEGLGTPAARPPA